LAALSGQPPKPEGSRRKARGIDGESACRAIMGPPLLRCSRLGLLVLPYPKFCAGPLPCDHQSDCTAYFSLDKNDDLRRACPNRSAFIAPQPYMRWILVGSEAMMRSCASTARLLGGGAHSVFRHASHRSSRATATSDHLGIRRRETGTYCRDLSLVLPSFCEIIHVAGCSATPAGSSPVLT
jgi:hypothetical protein